MTRFSLLRSETDLDALVQEIGFLPFFRCPIAGFSIAECTPRELWFTEEEGPWEWKGAVARRKMSVYGKFFRGKAGFVSLEWLPDFVNFRRDGYDFDARWDDELVSAREKYLYDTVAEHGALLSMELKELCNYKKGGNKGFETLITRLQMQTYLIVEDFEYLLNRDGEPYGWGIARYATPEHTLGDEVVRSAYRRTPEESRRRILTHLCSILPDTDPDVIAKLLG